MAWVSVDDDLQKLLRVVLIKLNWIEWYRILFNQDKEHKEVLINIHNCRLGKFNLTNSIGALMFCYNLKIYNFLMISIK